MFRQSGHHRIMGARNGPRDDGFRCGIWFILDLYILITSLMMIEESADDVLR